MKKLINKMATPMFSKITMATRMGAEPWNRGREGMSLVWSVLSLAIPTPQPQTRIGGWNQTSNSSEHEALQKSDLRKRLPVASGSAVTALGTRALWRLPALLVPQVSP